MRPQHLQFQETYLESVATTKAAALAPHDWGIVSVEVEAGDLQRGSFILRSFHGVLPSGVPVVLEGDTLPPARPFQDRLTGAKTLLEVFLGVPLCSGHAPAFDLGGSGGAHTRYRTSSRSVRDLTGEAREELITTAVPNATLLFGDESRAEYETIKIAEIVRDETGGFATSPTFIPPALKLIASPVLRHALRELLGALLAKHRLLSQARRHADAAVVEWNSGDISRFLVLSALGASIPVIRHLVEEPRISPHTAYLALVQLAGALTSFCTDVDPASFPAFDHGDLRSTFDGLFECLHRMLGMTVRDRAERIDLEARKDGMWIGKLSEHQAASCRRFVLAVETGRPAAEVLSGLPPLSKIASWKQIGHIVRSATPGVPLAALHRPPPEIPLRPNHIYFTLEEDAHLHAVTRERTVAIYLPPPFDPSASRLFLYGIPTGGTEA